MIDFRGFKFDQRTVDMIVWAEKKAGFKFRIVQGSYSNSVDASAGTHSGGGALDCSVRLMTAAKRNKMLNALKDAGFAAWYRVKAEGFSSDHIHAVAIGCMDLAPLAKKQVEDFDKRLNGLKTHNPDLTYRPNPPVKWSLKDENPVERKAS